jgi:hypothetical protein
MRSAAQVELQPYSALSHITLFWIHCRTFYARPVKQPCHPLRVRHSRAVLGLAQQHGVAPVGDRRFLGALVKLQTHPAVVEQVSGQCLTLFWHQDAIRGREAGDFCPTHVSHGSRRSPVQHAALRESHLGDGTMMVILPCSEEGHGVDRDS